MVVGAGHGDEGEGFGELGMMAVLGGGEEEDVGALTYEGEPSCAVARVQEDG